jgi:DNA-binding LacI/PurR family transcriptional regulator
MTRKKTSVTIREVAAQAGVSVATVSRYLNQKAQISPEVAARIAQVADELHYQPHPVARQLASARTQTIGFLLADLSMDFFGPLLAGVETVVREQAYNLWVATAKASTRSQRSPLGPHNTDGLIVFANSLSDQQLEAFSQANFPLVMLYRLPRNNLNLPFVAVENTAATFELIQHLITVHQRRRILFLRGPQGQDNSVWREQGYRAGLAAHHLLVDERLILAGNFETATAYQNLKRYLAENGPNFDAVFSGDDDAAIGVLLALREAGLRVPEDISVVGFDDSKMARFLQPPLTTVRAPTQLVGQLAAEQLFNLILGKPVEREILLPTEMVFRRSCGCDYCAPEAEAQTVELLSFGPSVLT